MVGSEMIRAKIAAASACMPGRLPVGTTTFPTATGSNSVSFGKFNDESLLWVAGNQKSAPTATGTATFDGVKGTVDLDVVPTYVAPVPPATNRPPDPTLAPIHLKGSSGRRCAHETGALRVAERGAQDLMHVHHGFGCERTAVVVSAAAEVGVEVFDVGDRQAAQRHATDVR